jgi:hypothetical protein
MEREPGVRKGEIPNGVRKGESLRTVESINLFGVTGGRAIRARSLSGGAHRISLVF